MKRYFYPHRFALRDEDIDATRQLALDQALSCLTVIDQRLKEQGPYHLGDRFSLVDLVVSYWLNYIHPKLVPASWSAINQCRDKVVTRAKLSAMFDRQKTMRNEYARLLATGGGAK